MVSKSGIQWKRLASEAIAIVGSILLAFWIDAWWGEQQQRAEEKVILSQILDELRNTQRSREGRERYLNGILEACRKLLEIARSTDSSASDREIDFLLNDTTWIGGAIGNSISALDSLYQSGDISVVNDSRITAQLSELRFALAMEDRYAQREVAFLDTRFYPFLDAHASIAQIYGAEDGSPGFTRAENEQWSQYPVGSEVVAESAVSHRELLGNQEFQNLLIQRTFRLNSLIGWDTSTYDVEKALQASIDRIEDRLTTRLVD